MISNFISDSVIQKFLRFAYAKFLKSFFLKNAWAESNSNPAWNFASNDMHWYGVYIDLTNDSHENNGVKRYVQWISLSENWYEMNIDPISMHIIRREISRWIRIWFRSRILEKKRFQNFFAWANLKNFTLYHLLWSVLTQIVDQFVSSTGGVRQSRVPCGITTNSK